MIRPTVVSITSLKFDFETEAPADLLDFEEWLEVEIEAASPDGDSYEGDEFRTCAVSAARVSKLVKAEKIVWGRPLIMVDQWSREHIRRAVDTVVSECVGVSWTEVVALLGRFFWVDLLDANPDSPFT